MRPVDLVVFENTFVCDCGVLIHFPTAKDDQFDTEKRKQSTICPACERLLVRP